MKDIQLVANLGDEVKPRGSTYCGTVTAITVRASHVMYEVTFWNEKRHTEWLYPEELESAPNHKTYFVVEKK